MIRTVVEEREYEVIARVGNRDENGEEVPRSDRIAEAIRIWNEAKRRSQHPAEVVEDENGPGVVVRRGDAPEPEFEEVAGVLLEVVGW